MLSVVSLSQKKTALTPAKRINKYKQLFDEAYNKESWQIHPTVIPFLTPMEIHNTPLKNGVAHDGLLFMTAPVNHNKLNQDKAIKIVHTILGNAYQSDKEVSVANQDFGNDASIIVGNHKKIPPPLETNRVPMKDLHPTEEQQKQITEYGLFDDNQDAFLSQKLKSDNFQDFLHTDASTDEGRSKIAKFYGVEESWTELGEQDDSMQAYYNLLLLVKRESKKDNIWISFWEGMHRHAAIIMSLLCSDITYDTNNCYVHGTLTKSSFTNHIKGYYADNEKTPHQIIREIFNGSNKTAKMLKTLMTVMAYIPTRQNENINEIMVATRMQSQHVSENKLSSATRTLCTDLSDYLQKVSPTEISSGQPKYTPKIKYRYDVQRAVNEKQYQAAKEKCREEEEEYEGPLIPKCIDGKDWRRFVSNPKDTIHDFTKSSLSSESNEDKDVIVSPPYKITFKSITVGALPIKEGALTVDVRHMNAYQIIPGIMYILQARHRGELVKNILNDQDITKVIDYVSRYCYATRSSPFNTMHAACVDYSISWRMFINKCEGSDEAIPVTVLLVSMYNACYAFQDNDKENLLITTLRGLEHVNQEPIPDRSFIRTFSEYEQKLFSKYVICSNFFELT
jgi:hypothetical protein